MFLSIICLSCKAHTYTHTHTHTHEHTRRSDCTPKCVWWPHWWQTGLRRTINAAPLMATYGFLAVTTSNHKKWAADTSSAPRGASGIFLLPHWKSMSEQIIYGEYTRCVELPSLETASVFIRQPDHTNHAQTATCTVTGDSLCVYRNATSIYNFISFSEVETITREDLKPSLSRHPRVYVDSPVGPESW